MYNNGQGIVADTSSRVLVMSTITCLSIMCPKFESNQLSFLHNLNVLFCVPSL